LAFIDFRSKPQVSFTLPPGTAPVATAPMPLDPQRHVGQLGPYRVLRDGFAESAHDGREVAVKVQKPSALVSTVFGNVFNHEARILEGVAEATHVPSLVAEGKVEGQNTIVMELVHGEELGKQLDGLTPKQARDVTLALLDAVGEMHELNHIHGDLNSGNLKLRWEGEKPVVTLLDVGGGGRLDERGKYQGVRYGGDWFSQAPEQFPSLTNKVKLTAASDLYFVGSLYARMLTGKDPFHTTSVLGVPRAIHLSYGMRKDPASQLDLPEGPVRELLLKALAFKPEERFQSAAEFAAAVRAAS
jgi:serine/threonine protein kinase